MNLSKSKYTHGVQCPKMLWMERHMGEFYDDSVMNQAVLSTGNEVGDLAMGYYGDFTEVPFDPDDPERFENAKRITRELLAAETPVICEATFDFDGNYCMVDILRRREDGTYDITEVKSSTHCKDIYLHDMAYQTWVVQSCGLEVRTTSLMHVDNTYVRHGELDLKGLFAVEDCTEKISCMLEEVPGYVAELKALAEQPDEPELGIGMRCFSPYECGYRRWCWRGMPSPSVFDIGRIRKDVAIDLHEQGIDSFEDLMASPAAYGSLNAKQKRQVRVHVEGSGPEVDVKEVSKFLGTLSYPLYFLDFETWQPAIPPFDDVKPYQQIPTQYSLHWIDEAGGELHHSEFLAEPGCDPRRSVAEHLVADIPMGVCTTAYNMSFEKGRIKEMAGLYPDLAEHLMDIHDHIRDLMRPFQSGAYYDDAMQGSYSIKYVLPALYPDDPELDYHRLEGVHNGGEAMAAFGQLEGMEREERERTREQLLRYCELDTYAMVKVWQRLLEAVA